MKKQRESTKVPQRLGVFRKIISTTAHEPPEDRLVTIYPECGHPIVFRALDAPTRGIHCSACLEEQNEAPALPPRYQWHKRPNRDLYCDICGAKTSGLSVWHRAVTDKESREHGYETPAYQKRIAAGILWFR